MRRSDLVILLLGVAGIVAGTLIGSRAGLVDALVAGPPLLPSTLDGMALYAKGSPYQARRSTEFGSSLAEWAKPGIVEPDAAPNYDEVKQH